jgi:hypothetical protein
MTAADNNNKYNHIKGIALCIVTKLTRNDIKPVIRVLIKYIVAVAVPGIWRNIERPVPIERGKRRPHAENMSILAVVTNIMLVAKK